jgi:hypothetical protein
VSDNIPAFVTHVAHIPFSYLRIDENDVVKKQQGVVRTNCMDNLDRTNVVQAFLAKRTLNAQLQSIGVLSPSASIDDYEDFSRDFRESKLALRHNISLTDHPIKCGPTMRTRFL